MREFAEHAMALGLGAALACEGVAALWYRARGGTSGPGPRIPRPALALALCGSVMALRFTHPATHGGADLAPGPQPLLLGLSGLVVFAAALMSDARRAGSERHFIALLLASFIAFLAGARIPFVGLLGIFEPVELGGWLALAMTLVWVFLVASVIELASLLPGLALLVPLGLTFVSWRFGGGPQTATSVALAAVLVGAIVGRMIGGFIIGGGRAMDKSEVLTLAYFTAILTTLTFVKSVALAGVVLPLGFISIALIVIGMRAFERSLLLRPTPRG